MATRKTNNKLVETLDNGKHRVSNTNEPAVESENARYEQLGPFRHANIAISLAAVAMTAGGVDADAPTSIIAGRNGVIVGVTYSVNAAISAGGASALSLQPAVGPAGAALAAQGTAFPVASGGAQSAVLNQAGGTAKGIDPGGVPFNEGDLLGLLLTSSGTFAPTTADVDCYLLVRWGS